MSPCFLSKLKAEGAKYTRGNSSAKLGPNGSLTIGGNWAADTSRICCPSGPVSALLSGRQFDAVGSLLYSLAEIHLRHEGRITYQSVIAFHFPHIFHGEREGGIVAFVIVKIIVRGERGTVFAFHQFRFFDLPHAFSRSVDKLSGELLQRTEHIAAAEEMCRIESLLIKDGDGAGFSLDGLGHRLADHFRPRVYDEGVGIGGYVLGTDRQEAKAEPSAEQSV